MPVRSFLDEAFMDYPMNGHRRNQSEIFLSSVSHYRDVAILTHDNPDPDGMASGWAIRYLLERKLGLRPKFVAGGEIIRAENRRLVELLRPPISLEPSAAPPNGDLLILIDTSLAASNHCSIDSNVRDVAIIDHHLEKCPEAGRTIYRDIREKVAATASIAASYLHEQKVDLPEDLATALLYAIQTETRGGQFHYSALDRTMLGWLVEQANPSHLAEIHDAPLPPIYFSDLVLSLQKTVIYGDCAICLLPQAHGPEIVGEMADLLIRCRSLRGVLCGALYNGDLLLSVRTSHRCDRDAARLTTCVLENLGRGGGHFHRAGGVVRKVAPGEPLAALKRELESRWIAAWGVSDRTPTHLVSRQDILRCL